MPTQDDDTTGTTASHKFAAYHPLSPDTDEAPMPRRVLGPTTIVEAPGKNRSHHHGRGTPNGGRIESHKVRRWPSGCN